MHDPHLDDLLRTAYKLNAELKTLIRASECGPGLAREDVATVIAADPSDVRHDTISYLLPVWRQARDAAWAYVVERDMHTRAARIVLHRLFGYASQTLGTKTLEHQLLDSAVSYAMMRARDTVLTFDPDHPSGLTFSNMLVRDLRQNLGRQVVDLELYPLSRPHSGDVRLRIESLDNWLDKARSRGCSGEDADTQQRELAWYPHDDDEPESDEPEQLPTGIVRRPTGKNPYTVRPHHGGKSHYVGGYPTVGKAEEALRAALERLDRGEPARPPKPRNEKSDLPKGITQYGGSYRVQVWSRAQQRTIYAGSTTDLDEAIELKLAAQQQLKATGRVEAREVSIKTPKPGSPIAMERAAEAAMKVKRTMRQSEIRRLNRERRTALRGDS